MSNDVAVDVRGLSKHFGDRVIFKDVSLQVRKSEVVAIIGPSGVGKSTFIRCINYLHPFDEGSITVLGHELHGTASGGPPPTRAQLREIRTHVGMVFQTFNLFQHLSVLENIVLGPMDVKKVPRAQAVERAMGLLEMMGLTARANMYPRRLSGGEQQRVAICRALAMDPQIMLFDEPTSMLDPELVGDVLEAIQRLAQEGMTMILVTHEMMFAKEVADTVVVMADNTIAEMGPARQILEAPRTLRAQNFLARVLRRNADEEARLTAMGGDEG
ncbi:MAG: amino acid ABC transporter ATP-binding protein [Thermaerobacter sp.]|nr:amino acid ABC transporter ATP-binding protein [Thermaerobacter sp.]